MTARTAYNMCRRKRKFTAREAKRVAGKMNARQEKEVHGYHCPICSLWHVGGVKNEDSQAAA